MLASWPRPCRLAALSFFTSFPARSTSTLLPSLSTSTSQPADKPQDSIFTAPESPWDHVFSDIDPDPSHFPPTQRIRARFNDGHNARMGAVSLSGRKPGKGNGQGPSQHQSLVQRSSGTHRQRASLTAREMSVFDEMFDLIFNAVSSQDGKSSGSSSPASASARTTASAATSVPSSASALAFSGQTPSIGRAGAPLNDLFRTLRRHTSRVRWTTAIDEELDRKKETMELFNTDHELFQWVMQEVFGESQRWEEEAKRAIAASGAGTIREDKKGHNRTVTTESSRDAAAAVTSSSSSSGSSSEHQTNHSIYPHLIAHAMRIFRTTYSNPSLSLAIFNHAARVSIPSYVFGCTAPAYNELIEAKWEGWGDLEGVCCALEEMRANGVKIDGRTRIVVEKVRREVGEARPEKNRLETEERANIDDVNPLARRVWAELGETEVMGLLHRIERLALRDRSRKSTSRPQEESWKSSVLQPGKDDGWGFDSWDKEKKPGDTKKQRRRAKPLSPDELPSRTPHDWTALGARGGSSEAAFR